MNHTIYSLYRKRASHLLAFLAILLISTSAINSQKTISKKQAIKDLNRIVDVVEAHPKPFRHITEEDWKKQVNKIKKQLPSELSILDEYRLLAPLMGAIRDGHSGLYLPENFMKEHSKEHGVLPFKVYINNEDKMYVIDNYVDNLSVSEGAEIIAMNDMAVKDFIEAVDPMIGYERKPFRNTIIERGIDQYLLLAFGPLKKIKIETKLASAETHEVDFIDYEIPKAKWEEENQRKDRLIEIGKPYEYVKVKNGIGRLNIFSFSFNSEKFEDVLRQTFGKIKEDSIHSLIIDVRENGGGYPGNTSKITHWVTNTKFRSITKNEMKVSQPYKDYFNKRAGTSLRRFTFSNQRHSIDLNSLMNSANGKMITTDREHIEEPVEKFHEFKGDLYLLTDRRSFSASSCLAANFKCYTLGTVVGSTTGGTQVFHANSMGETLPFSRFYCRVATARMYTTCFFQEDEGIIPHVEVEPSVIDLVNNNDPVLNYSLLLIRKRQKALKAAMEAKGGQ